MSVRLGGRILAGLVVFAVEHWSWLCLKTLCYLFFWHRRFFLLDTQKSVNSAFVCLFLWSFRLRVVYSAGWNLETAPVHCLVIWYPMYKMHAEYGRDVRNL